MIRFRGLQPAILTVVALACLSSTALAGGFAIREQSAEALGNAFAGVAAGTDGLSAMFWNPATIAQHNGEGLVIDGSGSFIAPSSRAKNGSGFLGGSDSGDIGQTALVPAMYMAYGVNDRLTLGLSVTAPFGLATDSKIWMGSLNGDKSEVSTINVSPSVAYKLSDWITVGAGVEAEWANLKLTSSTPAGVEVFKVKSDDVAYGFNAGVLLQPAENVDIGIGFRSSVSHDTKGDGHLGAFAGNMRVGVDTPETVTAGIRYRANDQWTLKAGAEWANWSRFKQLAVKGPGGITLASTPEHWDDSWLFAAGADYAMTDKLTLRGGVSYEISPVTDGYRTPRLPDNDRFGVALGASYTLNEHLTANLSYSHLFVADGKVNLSPPGSVSPLKATFKQQVNIVAAGATLRW